MFLNSIVKLVASVPRFVSSRNMSFYAVANGRKTGVFNSWAQCEEQIKGFTGAKFKKFSTIEEAQQFVGVNSLTSASGNQSLATSFNNLGKSTLNSNREYSTSSTSKLLHSSQINDPKNSSSHLKLNEAPKPGKGQQSYYAVAKGRNIGVYFSWADCKNQVDGFPYPKYKKFSTLQEAEEFIKDSNGTSSRTPSLKEKPVSKSNFTKDNNAGENLTSITYNGYQFNEDSFGYVHCFTDGSCESNGRVNARAGIGVWFGSNHPLNIGEPVEGPPTNNVAEIQAAARAIKVAKSCDIAKLQINTDSQFMIKCITEWMPKWKRNGWKLSSGGDVKNKEQLVELDKAMKEGVEVKWNYVQAHIGIEGNEHADRLARTGAANYKTKSQVTESARYKPY